MRLRARQMAVWWRIFTAGAEFSGLANTACISTSPAGSSAGNTSSPTNSSPVSPAQFSLKAPCTLCTMGPCRCRLMSA